MKKVRTRNDFIFMITMIFLFSAAGSMLTGCAGLSSVISKGADANDTLVNGSIKGMCDVYSVGAIKRKFNTKELRELYNKMCSTLNDAANEL